MRHGKVPHGTDATRWLNFFLGSFPAIEVGDANRTRRIDGKTIPLTYPLRTEMTHISSFLQPFCMHAVSDSVHRINSSLCLSQAGLRVAVSEICTHAHTRVEDDCLEVVMLLMRASRLLLQAESSHAGMSTTTKTTTSTINNNNNNKITTTTTTAMMSDDNSH